MFLDETTKGGNIMIPYLKQNTGVDTCISIWVTLFSNQLLRKMTTLNPTSRNFVLVIKVSVLHTVVYSVLPVLLILFRTTTTDLFHVVRFCLLVTLFWWRELELTSVGSVTRPSLFTIRYSRVSSFENFVVSFLSHTSNEFVNIRFKSSS